MCIYIYPPYFQSLAWKQSYLPFGDCFLPASVPSSGQHTTVGESLAHTKLTHLCTQPWGWGGAREEKCRIYQPHPLLNITIGTQPLLDFLRLTITLQPRGVGGAREEKGRIYQPHRLLNITIITIGTQPLLDFLRLTITLQPRGVGRG